MAYLSFVDDEEFRKLVDSVLCLGRDAKDDAKNKFDRNTIDPFSILWEMASFGSTFEEWYQSELKRQAQKRLANHIGMFHQKFLGLCVEWHDLGVGKMVDLVNHDQRIIAEIKNKHNTVTGGKQVDLYNDLHKLVMPNGQAYKDYTAYYVEIVPRKAERYDIPFTPSDRNTSSRCASNEKIRKIDGASFYALVTGIDDALEQVFSVLPSVIHDVAPYIDRSSFYEAFHYFNKAYMNG